jgi:uncharacterized protein YndB with AHSA1/START domain
MSANLDQVGICDRELVLTRIFDAPPEKVFSAWGPSEQPFMTVVLTSSKTPVVKLVTPPRVLHWTAAVHEQLGFHQGWGAVRRQIGRPAEAHALSA